MLRHAKHRVCAPLIPTNKHWGSQENSPAWAGNIAVGGGFSWVYSKWTVPCVGRGSGQGSDSGVWVGLGGDTYDGGGYLPQAGTEQGYDYGGVSYYDAWIEDYPYNGAQIVGNFPGQCNDNVSVYVSSNYDYANQVYFSLFDTATNTFWANSYYWPLSNRSTAEWIVERQYGILANFGTVTLTNCEARQTINGYTSTKWVGQLTDNYAVMWSSVSNGVPSGNELAYPGPISSDATSFPVTYVHSQ